MELSDDDEVAVMQAELAAVEAGNEKLRAAKLVALQAQLAKVCYHASDVPTSPLNTPGMYTTHCCCMFQGGGAEMQHMSRLDHTRAKLRRPRLTSQHTVGATVPDAAALVPQAQRTKARLQGGHKTGDEKKNKAATQEVT